MKKLLSLVIVAMMIVSCISNVFAVTADEVPASAPDNYVDLWLSDGVIDADDSVTLYVSVANNCGFWSMRYWIIYPDCLSVLNANHAILDEVLAGGGDATKGKQMTTATSSVATKGFQSLGLRAEDYLDGHHYMLADSIIVESVYDEDESGYYDVYGDGKLASFTFSYDASKNTEDLEKIPVLLFCDGLNRDHGELTDVFNDGTEEFLYRWYDGYVYVSAEAQAADTCAHANKSEVIVKQPSDGASNMNEGYRYIVCNDCGEKLQHIMWDGANYEPAPIEEHVHDYVLDEDASTPATCGENGENVYVCQGAGECDAPTYSEVVPATGEHTPGEAVDENVVPATCGEAGSKDVVVKCSVCGAELSRTPAEIPATGEHTPGAAVDENVIPATCNEAGSKDVVVYCEVCGAELSRTPAEIPATGEHTPGEVVIENERAATCQAGGYYEEVVYCTGCGSEISRTPVETPVGEHVASDTAGKVLQSPTLTDPGVGAYRCEVCMAVVEDATVEIAPIDGFTYWTEDQTVEPGATVSVPLYVNTSQYGLDNFAALAFWDNAIGNGARVKMELGVFEEDDDITSGSTVATPTRDMINRMSKSGVSDEFDKSGKYFKSFFLDTSMESMRPRIGEGAIVSINFTAPAEEGEYKVGFVFYDKYCATWFLDDNYEYPADGDIDYNPYIRGQVAEATITVETPACQHENTYTVDENVTPATCGEAGYKEVVVYCSDCEEEISRTPTEIPATGEHTAADPVDENVTPATCGEAGSKEVVVYCSVCGTELSRTPEEIPATGEHTAADPVDENVTPATCGEAGSKEVVVYCSVCGAELSRTPEEIPATGEHTAADPVDENVNPATCGEAGSKEVVVYCSVCGAELSRTPAEIPATGEHTPGAAVDENVVPATCGEAGSKEVVVYCEVCGAELSRTPAEIPATGEHTPGAWETERPATPTENGLDVRKCTVCGQTIDERETYYKILNVVLVPGAPIATGSINNTARTITLKTKKDQAKASYNLKLPSGATVTLDSAAFAAGNKMKIGSTYYSAPTEAKGIRYMVSYSANGFNQSYNLVITDKDGVEYVYTVNVEFVHSPACSGVEPGYTANADLTGFDPENDHQINAVAQVGANKVAFRLLLAKGATVRLVPTEGTGPHIMQTKDKGQTFVECAQVTDSAYAYFKTEKTDDNQEYDLIVKYANGETETYHVVASFPVDLGD